MRNILSSGCDQRLNRLAVRAGCPVIKQEHNASVRIAVLHLIVKLDARIRRIVCDVSHFLACRCGQVKRCNAGTEGCRQCCLRNSVDLPVNKVVTVLDNNRENTAHGITRLTGNLTRCRNAALCVKLQLERILLIGIGNCDIRIRHVAVDCRKTGIRRCQGVLVQQFVLRVRVRSAHRYRKRIDIRSCRRDLHLVQIVILNRCGHRNRNLFTLCKELRSRIAGASGACSRRCACNRCALFVHIDEVNLLAFQLEHGVIQVVERGASRILGADCHRITSVIGTEVACKRAVHIR